MNAATLAMVPLRAGVASTRWITVLVLCLMLIISVVLQLTQHAPKTTLVPPVISAYGEFFVGLLFMAPFLLMAVDMRQLRIPRSHSTIVLAMLLYGALWIAVPSIVLALAGANFLMVLAIQTVGLLSGLMFGLLPRVFLIVVGFTPSILGLMQIHLHYPEKPTILMLWLVAAVLALVCAFCWHRQWRVADPYGEGFNKPLVMRPRGGHQSGVVNWNDWTAWSGSSQQIRSRPRWLQAVANLRHAGPQNPVRSLRIGVGGWMLPKTWQSQWRQTMIVLSPLVLSLMLVYVRAPVAAWSFLHVIGFGLIVWITGFGSMFLALMTVAALQQRWIRTNAELPILALLPGLGDGDALKKHLLRATLLPALCWQGVLIAILVAAALVKQVTGLNLAICALIQIIALAFTPAFAFAIFGGRPPAPWTVGLIAGISFALVGCSTALTAVFGLSSTYGLIGGASIIAIWLAMLAFLVWLGVRGWHGLRERPHPFLAN